MSIQPNLQAAGQIYGACARKVQTKCASHNAPTAQESELLIGLGIASDWARRAAALKPLQYTGKLMNKSTKSPAITEMIRFTMAWSGLNGLFARPAVLKLLGNKTSGTELELFRILLANSNLSPQRVAAHESVLQTILAANVTTTVPGHPPGTSLMTVQVLHEKYTPVAYQSMSIGKQMQRAIVNQSTTQLDLATLIYAMRNWSVHGSLVGSSFRSVPGFNRFINTIVEAISEVHLGVSKELLKNV